MYNKKFYVMLNRKNNRIPIFQLPLENNFNDNLYNIFIQGIERLLKEHEKVSEFQGSYRPTAGEMNKISNYNLPREILEIINSKTNLIVKENQNISNNFNENNNLNKNNANENNKFNKNNNFKNNNANGNNKFNGNNNFKNNNVNEKTNLNDNNNTSRIKMANNNSEVKNIEPVSENLLNIRGLFTIINKGNKTMIGFQNITRSNYVTGKNTFTLFYDENNFKEIKGKGINISKNIDVFYDGQDLYFKNYWTARQILDLSTYYRLATHNDLKRFIKHNAICVSNKEKIVEISDSWIRQKVAMLMDANILDICEIEDIVEIAKDYNIEIKINEDNKIILPEERNDLKKFLRFLDEDYFTGPLTNIIYKATTKRMKN